MRIPVVLIFLSAVALGTAAAQTKISGTVECAKPETQHSIDIGDRPNHSFAIGQGKCTWTKPFEIAGTQSKEDVFTNFAEASGNTSRERGYVEGTLANGDKFHVRTTGTTKLKDGTPQGSEGKWNFAGGTGKVKGVKGGGEYKCKPAAEGALTCDVEGEATLPK